MKVIDLTGENRVALGFHVDLLPDGGVVGRFEASKIDGANFAVGQAVPAGTPDLTELQIKFDNPDSVAVFIRSLTNGYNKMAYRIMQEQVRKDALAQVKQQEAQKKQALAARIEQMARDLSALQGEYAELNS